MSEYIAKWGESKLDKRTWTKENPQKGKFKGLVSILNKGARNPDFPYKKMVLCPYCHKPLFGSASRGRLT
jgi:hypothetical protein